MIISIDGPAGSGKSTVAKIVSKKLGFDQFNSGLLYRGITAFLYQNDFNFEEITIDSYFTDLTLETKFQNGIQRVIVNNIDVTSMLRDNNISVLTPIVSTNRSIRTIIDNCQRNYAKNKNIVIDGRDIGSFVFPNAEVKIYLDCSIKERAKRRFFEEKQKNPNITLEQIEQEIEERDFIDRTKEIAPLIIPEGATIIDSTILSIDEVVDKILDIASLFINTI